MKLQASWANAYPTVAAMVQNSDAVVRGVVGVASPTVVQDGIPYTDFAFRVSTWIKAKGGTRTDISIRQTGGIVGGAVQVVEDDPLLVPDRITCSSSRNTHPASTSSPGARPDGST